MSRFLLIFEMMKKWSPTAKTRMLCNMKQDMKVMKNKFCNIANFAIKYVIVVENSIKAHFTG